VYRYLWIYVLDIFQNTYGLRSPTVTLGRDEQKTRHPWPQSIGRRGFVLVSFGVASAVEECDLITCCAVENCSLLSKVIGLSLAPYQLG